MIPEPDDPTPLSRDTYRDDLATKKHLIRLLKHSPVLHKHQTEKCFPNAEIAGKLLTNRLFIKLKYNIPKHLQIGDLQKSIKPANNCRNVGWVDTK